MRHAVVFIRTSEPDHSNPPGLPRTTHAGYHGSKEEIPKDIPESRGTCSILTSSVDVNLLHDLISSVGRRSQASSTWQTRDPLINWFAKSQATGDSETFRSECVVARSCAEQIIDIRNTLRCRRVPVEGSLCVFGDNKSAVNAASVPHSKLGSRAPKHPLASPNQRDHHFQHCPLPSADRKHQSSRCTQQELEFDQSQLHPFFSGRTTLMMSRSFKASLRLGSWCLEEQCSDFSHACKAADPWHSMAQASVKLHRSTSSSSPKGIEDAPKSIT